MRVLLFLSRQILFPYLFSLNLLIIHLLHLAVQLATTILNIENFAALQSLLIAVKQVDNENSNGDPNNQHTHHYGLEADVINYWQTLLFIDFFIVELFFYLAMRH